MDFKNLLLIMAIIAACIGVVIYYINALKKASDEIEYESIYSLKYLTDGVAKVFADTQKTNLKEQNLSKRELEAEMRKKLELRRNLKTAAFGDKNAKTFAMSFIKEIIQSKNFDINSGTIDYVIPFNNISALDIRNKTDIIFYLYQRQFGGDGFKHFMQDYSLKNPKPISEEEEEDGALMYEITKEDIENIFAEIYRSAQLSFDDKLEIVARRIFADYKGFGPIDTLYEFSMDEIDCGVSGVAKGTYDLKKEMMTDDFEYSFHSIYVVYSGLNIKLSCMSFGTQEELVRICQNVYKYSAPYALSRRKGFVVGTMKDGSRIAVARPPVSSSWCFFLRKFDSTPSLAPTALLKDDRAWIPITVSKWIMKATRTMMITGGMGTGKTTWLKSIIRYIPSGKNLRVYEISPELNLQFTYPKRNIVAFSTTESISMQSLYDFGKKANANVNIVGESASAEMGVIFIQSATVGSEQALGTHHAKTAEDLVLSLRDNLTTAGGYSSEKVAEEVVAKCVNFNTHMGREKDHRFMERITEIIPIRDRRYPSDMNADMKAAGAEDTKEYYRRQTDRRTFTVQNIVEYRRGQYHMVRPISEEMKMEMRSRLSEEDEKLFLQDMALLESYIGR